MHPSRLEQVMQSVPPLGAGELQLGSSGPWGPAWLQPWSSTATRQPCTKSKRLTGILWDAIGGKNALDPRFEKSWRRARLQPAKEPSTVFAPKRLE
eukprot:CAMPEP_0198534704 /NCGR_PEP_ID=MMETSP1462-20131121/36591_1 /TAXON_ID=1333877 /ORGANISM="Brandtodinium nutriculum, Strain RCC3387" /LENGTH=95 /DNA_ID=CAMNT_0044264627 /DNA_START=347 /DNA_END=631 /DNA_ORIENTATION=-